MKQNKNHTNTYKINLSLTAMGTVLMGMMNLAIYVFTNKLGFCLRLHQESVYGKWNFYLFWEITERLSAPLTNCDSYVILHNVVSPGVRIDYKATQANLNNNNWRLISGKINCLFLEDTVNVTDMHINYYPGTKRLLGFFGK